MVCRVPIIRIGPMHSRNRIEIWIELNKDTMTAHLVSFATTIHHRPHMINMRWFPGGQGKMYVNVLARLSCSNYP